jgi:hypothetical protein
MLRLTKNATLICERWFACPRGEDTFKKSEIAEAVRSCHEYEFPKMTAMM